MKTDKQIREIFRDIEKIKDTSLVFQFELNKIKKKYLGEEEYNPYKGLEFLKPKAKKKKYFGADNTTKTK